MDNPKQQIAERLKQANNVLVTVSTNPSVDQLAACIGLTLMLNKLGKHATAVFSGQIPSTIEFLQPEATLEKTTDSLRDFIISLDKAKADKLRYKVEDKVVKIFITPYRSSIGEKDLEFSQGDFNVDVVVALGVHEQTDLDQAITAHGRILHDATVATISTAAPSSIGALNWQDPAASSLSEVVASLSDDLGKNMLDGQIATSLLTGIVAETERFSNDKTSAQTMSVSARLMSAGANQQLVATKLEQSPEAPADLPLEPSEPSVPVPLSTQPPAGPGPTGDQPLSTPTPAAPRPEPPKPPSNDGMLEVPHDGDKKPEAEVEKPDELADKQINIDDQGILHRVDSDAPPAAAPQPPAPAAPTMPPSAASGSHFMSQPPSMGGTLTANTTPEGLDPPNDALSLPNVEPPLLHRPPEPSANNVPASPPAATPPAAPLTPLSSTPSAAPAAPNLDALRSNVDSAAASSDPLPEKPDAFNSQIAFDNLHVADAPAPNPIAALPAAPSAPPLNQVLPSDEPVDHTLDMPEPPHFVPPAPLAQPPTTDSDPDAAAPPPVPPPLTLPSQ